MADGTDIFGQLAPLLHVRPELQQLCRFGAQWASGHAAEAAGWAPFHIVTRGACLLDVADRTGILLRAGDAAVLPHGTPHTVRALPGAGGEATVLSVHRRVHDALLVKSNVAGEPDTGLICGRLRFRHAHGGLLVAALPSVIVLSGQQGPDALRMRHIVELMQAELAQDRLGAAAIASALAAALMMLVLRAHFESRRDGQGILALLARGQTARALAGMLAEPARAWTLDGLAAQANTSRATLVRLFRASVGQAPLAFLAELRLTLARHRVQATRAPLALIAEAVGYRSEASFSRAYRRRFAIAPGADRRAGG